ncbi:MAG: hypothetical protein V7771_07530 [Shewanella psychromarinicola]|uniref:hypothetical protein n=1 Tax=Shewanella psychromarinicola TaxID=2487742 RepID=UPI0030030139
MGSLSTQSAQNSLVGTHASRPLSYCCRNIRPQTYEKGLCITAKAFFIHVI